jgi:hypothetical protein
MTNGASNSASCVVRPALTEGPYFVDEKLNRSDIRSDPSTGIAKDGALLVLTFNVSRVASNACAALSGAIVDVWLRVHVATFFDDALIDTIHAQQPMPPKAHATCRTPPTRSTTRVALRC